MKHSTREPDVFRLLIFLPLLQIFFLFFLRRPVESVLGIDTPVEGWLWWTLNGPLFLLAYASLPCYVDGNFATDDDIQSLGQRGITVFAPVKEAARQLQAGKTPHVRQPDDQEYVGTWRERMGTPTAHQKYKQRSKTEFPNATCRNRGLYQFLVRGLEKVLSVVLWYVLAHNLFRRVALSTQ